ncbi:MAG: ABC transporter substrate-binding protein [Hyphomicrobiaceae bacterium]
MPRRPTAAVAVAVALATIFAAWPAAAQKAGGTLRTYIWDNPPSASIHEEATVSTTVPFMPIFNNLVLYDQHAQLNTADTIKPELAESWSWDGTGTKLTFKLRQGVQWHDGKPFTAKDVVCTMDLLQGKAKDRFRKNPRKIWWHNLKEVTAGSDHEVTFHLGRPQASFVALFATGYNPVYPCHVSAADMRTKPIGTGPFKLVEFKSNEVVKLVRNPDYWRKGRPYLDAIEARVIANRSTRILTFVAGELDMTQVLDLTPALVRDIQSQAPKAICEIPPTNNSVNLIVNRDKPPFDEAKLRTALALSIDRKAFNTIIYEGKTKIGGAMMAGPEGSWGMPDEVVAKLPGYSADVEKSRAEARKIMESLGYTADKPLKLKVSTRSVPLYRDPAVILVDQLKTIHIDGELDVVDASIWFGKVARGDYAVGVNTTAPAIDDPDVNLYENYACGSERNYTKYCNPEVDKLIDAQSRETSIAKRREIVWKIEEVLAADVARPIIVQGIAGLCRQPHMKGFVLHHNGIYNNWRFDDVWLDK